MLQVVNFLPAILPAKCREVTIRSLFDGPSIVVENDTERVNRHVAYTRAIPREAIFVFAHYCSSPRSSISAGTRRACSKPKLSSRKCGGVLSHSRVDASRWSSV